MAISLVMHGFAEIQWVRYVWNDVVAMKKIDANLIIGSGCMIG